MADLPAKARDYLAVLEAPGRRPGQLRRHRTGPGSVRAAAIDPCGSASSGAGGREHALAAALARTAEVVVTPGNPGHPRLRGRRPPEELDADLYVIGPEAPLVDGLADRLRARGALVFGPGR